MTTNLPTAVIPAKAGIQTRQRFDSAAPAAAMDSRLHGNDGVFRG
jgi:hypothetical protein